MISKEFIFERNVNLNEKTLTSGGSWDSQGIYDKPFISKLLLYVLSRNYKHIFDIGASTGQVAFFPLFNENINVWCFEPQKEIYDILTNNVELNSIKNTKCYNFAISNSDEEAIINKPKDLKDSGLATLGRSPTRFKDSIQEVVNTITLDSFVKQNDIKHIDIIKIDTEGFEYQVLAGARATLQNYKPDIVVEIVPENMKQCDTTIENLQNLISDLNYKIVGKIGHEDYLLVHSERLGELT